MSYNVFDQLRAEEGVKRFAYKDSEGWWTIGVGRLIDERKGGGLRPDEIEHLLRNDVAECEYQVRKDFAAWYDLLNEPRKAVILGMCFQMGFKGLRKFTTTLRHVSEGNYESAAANMLRSLWARQTPERAKRMAEQMRTGVWQKKT